MARTLHQRLRRNLPRNCARPPTFRGLWLFSLEAPFRSCSTPAVPVSGYVPFTTVVGLQAPFWALSMNPVPRFRHRRERLLVQRCGSIKLVPGPLCMVCFYASEECQLSLSFRPTATNYDGYDWLRRRRLRPRTRWHVLITHGRALKKIRINFYNGIKSRR